MLQNWPLDDVFHENKQNRPRMASFRPSIACCLWMSHAMMAAKPASLTVWLPDSSRPVRLTHYCRARCDVSAVVGVTRCARPVLRQQNQRFRRLVKRAKSPTALGCRHRLLQKSLCRAARERAEPARPRVAARPRPAMAPPPSPFFVSDLATPRPVARGAGDATGTMPAALAAAARDRPDDALFVTPDGAPVSAAAFYALARRVGKALVASRLARGEGAVILGFNSIEWFAADWGAMLAGVLPAPSYQTNSPEVVAYIMDHSRAGICFVDDEDAMVKAIAAKAQAQGDSCRSIVVWADKIDMSKYRDHASYLLLWDEFLQMGDDVPDTELDNRMQLAQPDECAKLIYTSGTTGPPKAVMISHDNMHFTAEVIVDMYKIKPGDTSVSFLPASHIAANTLDCMGPVLTDITVHFARPDALQGSLVDTLKRVRPTHFYAVPRVWEKIQERMLGLRRGMGRITLAISDWAKATGAAACDAEDRGERMPFGTGIAERLVFSNVRRQLGLDRARLIVNTAAPLQPVTSDYFRSLRMRILDIYGMSEGTGGFTTTSPSAYKRGSVGRVIPGIDMKLADRDAATGEGELCFRGRNVFMGYLSSPGESAAAFDEEGYLRTGDLARVDDDGYVFITGRAKELMVTSGGENVAPALIESLLISAMPALSRAFAVGDARKYVACLLVPYMEDDGTLIGEAAIVSASVRMASEIAGDQDWTSYIERGIAKANEGAISNVAKVKRHAVLTSDFSVDPRPGCSKGELTPTLKVKRKIAYENYAALIDSIYKD